MVNYTITDTPKDGRGYQRKHPSKNTLASGGIRGSLKCLHILITHHK